ncbi:FAD-binding oxidoreductase [Halomonas daqingensis]|uniref:FAD-dependent oxidoreductase n=1 Tax=Billgrantia desiderata TaxID=52021 RepID=UPI001F193519|nr:FAD-dependent oxidoreductase [Halomonas desiderata]MCE8028692.1 FAD-binding oxidoreductase [Halomonas desiderata]
MVTTDNPPLTLQAPGTAPLRPYDPSYDPLRNPTPGHGCDYAPTYWADTAGGPPADDGPVNQDLDVDVAIIGAGLTGLATAIFLAKEYGIRATVLEANRIGWGCSMRSGGQAQCNMGRLKRSEWIERYGLELALRLHAECRDGMETFKGLIEEIECEPQHSGHLLIAHHEAALPQLEQEAELLRKVFDYDVQLLDAAAVKRSWVGDQEAAGAMHEPEGIGVHPGKLAFGYLEKARSLGARVHPLSPVEGWATHGDVHHLTTPGGVVKARAVAIATGGYTSPSLHNHIKSRLLPILSNSVVTRPLSQEEREACRLRSHGIITDTRILRNYYRLLPDNRLQFGSRSAITGRDAPSQKHEDKLMEGMLRKFPALDRVRLDYSWWGWVDVSHDMMPRIHRPDPQQCVFYALGYGGNGVMFSAQAGKRMAQRIAGDGQHLDLPIFSSQLPFPNVAGLFESRALAPFRRLGQRCLYQWYQRKDEAL